MFSFKRGRRKKPTNYLSRNWVSGLLFCKGPPKEEFSPNPLSKALYFGTVQIVRIEHEYSYKC